MRGKMKELLLCMCALFIFTAALVPASALAALDQATKREIDIYLDKKMAKKSWLPSKYGEMFELHGEMEFEYISTQNEENVNLPDSTTNKKPHFQFDKIVLMPIGHFGKHNMLKLELEWHQTADGGSKVDLQDTYFQANYLLGEDAPLGMDLWFGAGRDERWMKPGRITESYPILGTIAWRDDELQFVVGLDTDFVYWRGSFGSGFDLSTKQIGEDSSFKIMQDDTNHTMKEFKRELGTGIGFRCGESDLKADLLTYYFNDEMNAKTDANDKDQDVDILAGIDNYDKLESGKPSPIQHRLGSRLTLDAYGAKFMGEYLYLQDGLLRRHAWYTLLAYTHKFDGYDISGRQWLVGITPLVRFDKLDVIIDKSENDTRTWDRWGTTAGLIIEIIKHVKIKNEFTWNKERTGGVNRVDNNEFLSQLEVRF